MDALKEEWNKLDMNIINGLIESMLRRLQAVIDNNGGIILSINTNLQHPFFVLNPRGNTFCPHWSRLISPTVAPRPYINL